MSVLVRVVLHALSNTTDERLFLTRTMYNVQGVENVWNRKFYFLSG